MSLPVGNAKSGSQILQHLQEAGKYLRRETLGKTYHHYRKLAEEVNTKPKKFLDSYPCCFTELDISWKGNSAPCILGIITFP